MSGKWADNWQQQLQIRGTASDSSDHSKRTLRIGTSSALSSCRKTGLILSGPAAYFGFKIFNSFTIPASETLISGIMGVRFLRSSGKASGTIYI